MTTSAMKALEAALAALDAPRDPVATATGARARAAHAAYLADIAKISRQHAAKIKSAPGYNAALGAFYSPVDSVAFVEAMGREADVEADLASRALQMAAE